MLIKARMMTKRASVNNRYIKMTIGKELVVEDIEQIGKVYRVWRKEQVAIDGKNTLDIARQYALYNLIDEIHGLSADKSNWFFRIEKPTYYGSYSTFRLSRGDRRMVVSMWYHGNHCDATTLSYTGEHKRFDSREFMQDVVNYVKQEMNRE